MEQTFEYNGLVELLKRASHSGYKILMLHDRMLLNCYDVDRDDDIGMHYVLHIPETEQYQSPLYELDLVINLDHILGVAGPMKKEHEMIRKSKKIRPKEAPINGRYEFYEGYVLLSFDYMLKEELWKTAEVKIPYPVSPMDSVVTNIESSYNSMLDRLDLSVPGVVVNGLTEEIRESVLERVRVFYYPVKIGDSEVLIPFMKSFFRNIRTFEQFDISVQKTNIKKVYLVVHTFSAKGLTDQYIMYVEDFQKGSK